MIDGAKLGVLVMLAITLAVQGAFVSFFLYLRKQREAQRGGRARRRMVGAPKAAENIMTYWLGMPELAATHGRQIDGLIGWVHVFMLILFVGLGRVLPLRPGPFPAIAASGGGLRGGQVAQRRVYLEVGVAVVEAILLFGFAIPLWAARVDQHSPESEALVVQRHRRAVRLERPLCRPRRDIRPHRHQPDRPPVEPLGVDRSDPAAKDDVTTVNQIYLPVNKPIIVNLRSKDVIHSFGVPEFRVKQDAIPGLTIPIWFIPDVTTAEMRTRTGIPSSSTRSPARSSAV